jgi:hypothetical protein
MNDGGVVAINIVGSLELIASITKTMRTVFSEMVLLSVEGSAQLVVLGWNSDRGTANWSAFAEPGGAAAVKAVPGIDFKTLRASAHTVKPPAALPGKILTDDFAPTEFLGRER